MTKRNLKTRQNKQRNAWFVRVRGSYLPAGWQGWLTYIPYAAYLIFSIVVAFAYTGTTPKAILWIVPNAVAAAVIMTWLAQLKS